MEVVEEVDGATLVLRLRGELDMATVPPFRDILSSRFASGEFSTVVIDLGGLTFTDSAGLTILVEASEQATEAGVELALTGVSRQVRKLMEITSLVDLFQIR
ncbi:STAS domain-containing protein [Jatrophihabitans sp. YIM 134969]